MYDWVRNARVVRRNVLANDMVMMMMSPLLLLVDG